MVDQYGTITIDFFQTFNDPNLWTLDRTRNLEGVDVNDGVTPDGVMPLTTEEIVSDPENEGKLAIVSGNFSVPGLLLIVKAGTLVPAKAQDFV